jgi:hypothetical protein
MFHDFEFNFLIPMALAMVLTLGRIMANQSYLTLDETNDLGLDWVMVSLGAVGGFYLERRSVDSSMAAGVGDALIGAVLLYMRYQQQRRRARLKAQGRRPEETGWAVGIVQMMLGVLSILWTVKAF